MNPERSERIEIPVLPLRDVVVYPHMVIPLFVGREKSIRCLEAAMDHDKKIMLVAQKEASTDEPGVNDLFTVGTVASILQMLKLPDGTVKVLVEGLQRARISALSDNGEHFSAKAEYLESPTIDEREQEVLVRTAISQFEGYIKLNKKIPPEVLTSLNSIDDPARLADTIAAHMPLKLADKQSVLEMSDVNERLEYLMAMMESEIDLLQVEKRIRNRVKKQMEKSQREYYLNEQMKAIQKELGEMDDAPDENEALKRKIDAAKMPKEAKEKAEAELQKLKMMSPMSAEATVVRGYIDWMVQVPWNARSKVKKDLRQAQEILDTDHYGLERVKDRILEYLAVQSRVNKIKGPILCLVGPPGVGKTSLGQSIAKATGRKYVRMALGGVRDEAEIRGHRRTYIGSMPGKLIQKMAKVGVKNPLFLLDEIDKMSSDMRGDPASALLEVLDPEQNVAFSDHYLEVDYDLSDVMFVATSNSMNIPAPLLDRMEVIRLSGMNLIIDDTDHPLIIKVASIQSARMQVYFIDNDDYFQNRMQAMDENGIEYDDNDSRAIFYARGVLETVKKLRWCPDVIHCHGWMTALAPLYIKKAYKDEPSFRDAKVVFSVYEDDFKNTLSDDFATKLMLKGITRKDLGDLKEPVDYAALCKLAVDYSDGVIQNSEKVDESIIEYARQSGKLVLDYQNPENYADACNEFYDQVWDATVNEEE